MTQLIVNADDFGLTSGVNRAIAELHHAGIVTSTSLMARAAATEEAIAIARSTPSLGVGCHIVLTDGDPVLPPEEIPHLIDPKTGRFRNSLAAFLGNLYGKPGQRQAIVCEMETEAAAQIAFLQSRGLRLTHVDAHKHAHIFPAVLRPVLRAAKAAGVSAIRNPFEPMWALCATHSASWIRLAEVCLLRSLEPVCRRIMAEAGFTTTSGTIAVVGTGHLDFAAVTALLSDIQPGSWELVTHPGYNDADLARIRTRLRASREIERAALQAVKNFPGLALISFAGLQAQSNIAVGPFRNC